MALTWMVIRRNRYTLWAIKGHHFYYCNNFVYCRPIFIIFGTYILLDICNKKIHS